MKHIKKWYLYFTATALFVLGTFASASAQSRNDSIETFLRNKMRERRIPGMQVAVVHHGQIVFLKALGVANVEDSVPVTNQTLFPVHSITKAFTGVAVMQLVEAGKLELSAPVSRYLDSLPKAWQKVTILQLMTHMSGLPDIWDNTPRMIDNDDSIAWVKTLAMPVLFAPGERFLYTQTNYVLIGKIIGKLSGEPFTKFIKDRQLNPAGMLLSGFGDSYDVVPHISGSYWYYRSIHQQRVPSDQLQTVIREWPKYLWTALGLNTTAEELAKWTIALQQGKILKKTSLATLWTPGLLNDGTHQGFSPQLNGYGLGWPVGIRPEHRIIGPTGGGRAAFYIYPDDDLTIIVLTNLLFSAPQSYIDEIAGYYIPDMQAANGFGFGPQIRTLRLALLKRGFDHSIEVVRDLKKKDVTYQPSENDLINWGYALLGQAKKKEAFEIFRLSISLYPNSWNSYDSEAEVYEDMGDRENAIRYYKRSLELNPKNTNGIEHLRKLQSQ